MSLSREGSLASDTKPGFVNKATTLNPNAAEFVPFSLRTSSSQLGSSSQTTDASAKFTPGTVGKAVLDRLDSSVSNASNASDDEVHQFWRHQLPDDITPDFKIMGEEESQGVGGLSLDGLSLNEQPEPSPRIVNGINFGENMRYGTSSFRDDANSTDMFGLQIKPWDKQIVSAEQVLGNGNDSYPYNGNSRLGLMRDMVGEPAFMEDMRMNPLDFLAAQFPGFAAESLAEVYFANGCDLNLTVEMLTQLELQVNAGADKNMSPKNLSMSAPNLSGMEFPALTVGDGQNGSSKFPGDDIAQSRSPYHSFEKNNMLLFNSSDSFPMKGAVDFASAVRKTASQDPGIWKYGRNGSADSTVGSSRSSHVLAGSYNSANGRGMYEKLQNRSSARAAPVWLETGDTVANLYSELREEARDHARLRNAYFEQARQAYLIGNKALAKELSAKGQVHNMHMKAAHGKAQESIYRQRNPISLEMQGDARAHERMIDLHGLHVSEAIHVLKHELSVLRGTARAAKQRLQVYICVGTGHHTRGSRTPARLPIAVQRYLLEEEGLDFSETQPGLLRVVIY